MSTRRFRIAFSFAGEKRAFVKAVAAILAEQFGEDKILYDEYHEAEFARYNLGIYLPQLYGEQSDLIVPVLCPRYDVKRWTGWEWTHIYGLLTRADGPRVMPCRFEYATADGLSPAAGFVELDHKTPAQAATLILERLALNEGQPKGYYTKDAGSSSGRSRANIPNNLPRLPAFFGREAELQKIAAALAPDARAWGALIDGPGGIGKTALAIRAAELIPAGRFRRIIFLSSKERELTADGQRALGDFVLPSYLEMLNAIARELAQPDLAKSPEAERSEAVLRALREAEVLLVLDNLETLPASDRDQLFAFLNRLPRGCSALVTSRRRADASASIVRLDKLTPSAALALLAELAKHNDQLAHTPEPERRALYEETGGNPLLMRWVVGQLGLGRCKTINYALAFLRSAPAANNPLEFIFGDLLDTFTTNETKVLAALTHFTTPMAAKFIAELASLNEAAAQGALSDLANRALVLPDLEDCYFALVPMVADFLRRKQPEVIKETSNRLEEYAYALIVENGYQNYERFPLLADAWPTVAPAIPLFLAGPNPRLQTVCDALDDFLDFTGRWDEWLSLSQQAEARAIAADDLYYAGWRARQAGWIHSLRQQADAVLACADQVAAHWQAAQAGARERAIAIRLRGIGHQLKQDYPAALIAYREVLDLHRSLSVESKDVALTLNDLADVEQLSGNFTAAERHYREALRVARAVGYTEGVAIFTGNLAALALDREDWSGAEALAREALPLVERVGHQELIASNCNRIAKALVRQGQAAEALPYARRAVAIFTQLGSPRLASAQATLQACEG
ncbi:MAG: tetratricopeptide repeat protein [Leptolyngbya sp. SIO1E4]|nr:tetratricopeptide repeat protein [Leptolyngbya sp. SIO1E4]